MHAISFAEQMVITYQCDFFHGSSYECDAASPRGWMIDIPPHLLSLEANDFVFH
jgi:hypothetical protein